MKKTANQSKRSISYYGIALVFLMCFYGCASSISTFNQQAYKMTTSLKVDALCLMDSAQDNYTKHVNEINQLNSNLQKSYEYEKNRPQNEITVRQWDLLLDRNGHLLGGFIERWKIGKTMSKTFIDECKNQVSAAFDCIAGLESHKINRNAIK